MHITEFINMLQAEYINHAAQFVYWCWKIGWVCDLHNMSKLYILKDKLIVPNIHINIQFWEVFKKMKTQVVIILVLLLEGSWSLNDTLSKANIIVTNRTNNYSLRRITQLRFVLLRGTILHTKRLPAVKYCNNCVYSNAIHLNILSIAIQI